MVKNKKKTGSNRKPRRMDLVREFRIAQQKANRKLKEMNKSGLRELNPQYSKKWDIYLSDPKFATKQGLWRGDATKLNMKQLKNLTAVLETFNTNRYNTVEFTRSYVGNQMEKLGIENPQDLSRLYQIWREYGFASDYDSDPEALVEMAIWYNNSPSYMDLGNWISQFVKAYEERMQMAATTDDIKAALKRYNQNKKEYPIGI